MLRFYTAGTKSRGSTRHVSSDRNLQTKLDLKASIFPMASHLSVTIFFLSISCFEYGFKKLCMFQSSFETMKRKKGERGNKETFWASRGFSCLTDGLAILLLCQEKPPPCIPAHNTCFAPSPACSTHFKGRPDEKRTGLPQISTVTF